MDADAAIWCSATRSDKVFCLRVREGGEILEEFETERPAFACMLGDDDGKTLYTCEARWRGIQNLQEVTAARAGSVVTRRAPAPRAGYP